MCRQAERRARSAATDRRRRRLWEIAPSCHCLICGTCLSVAELRKIAAKAGMSIAAGATDYEIHSHFAHCAGEAGPLAKLVQKALDRKYGLPIEHCRRLRSARELEGFWDRSLGKGDVPGPFWALMTHPATNESLAIRIFGDVHMLSHLEGSSNRADLRRLDALGRENQDLAKRLSAETTASRRRLAERDSEIRALRRQLREAEALSRRFEAAAARLERYEAGTGMQALNARIAELESLVRLRDEEAASAESGLARRDAELQALRSETDTLRGSLRLLEAECDSLAALLQSLTSPEAGTGPSGILDLSGRRIVYVGGRTGLVAHFRALVERANGRFIHHDGGIEESERRLGRLLAQGDVVLCPVDCVSHRACLRAKRFCKRTARRFVPLRSSGLSSFVSGLQQIAD